MKCFETFKLGRYSIDRFNQLASTKLSARMLCPGYQYLFPLKYQRILPLPSPSRVTNSIVSGQSVPVAPTSIITLFFSNTSLLLIVDDIGNVYSGFIRLRGSLRCLQVSSMEKRREELNDRTFTKFLISLRTYAHLELSKPSICCPYTLSYES